MLDYLKLSNGNLYCIFDSNGKKILVDDIVPVTSANSKDSFIASDDIISVYYTQLRDFAQYYKVFIKAESNMFTKHDKTTNNDKNNISSFEVIESLQNIKPNVIWKSYCKTLFTKTENTFEIIKDGLAKSVKLFGNLANSEDGYTVAGQYTSVLSKNSTFMYFTVPKDIMSDLISILTGIEEAKYESQFLVLDKDNNYKFIKTMSYEEFSDFKRSSEGHEFIVCLEEMEVFIDVYDYSNYMVVLGGDIIINSNNDFTFDTNEEHMDTYVITRLSNSDSLSIKC